jgi:DNA-binding SARP family transcriptional activator/class 3 adenylate cyclase
MDGAPSPRFRLSLLGRFELTGPDGVVDLPSKKLAGLLAYLGCAAPYPQPRERLSALLWGSYFDAQAKQNLRQALFRLRKVLGEDALASDGEAVSLNAAVVLCDVNRFEALVREGSRDALSAAADLYRGRLVDDVAVGEEGWNEWLTAERERLLELALGALMALGEHELAAGRAEHALKAGQRAIALNAMREDAHRLIVTALAATGRRAEALKHYEELVALLKREVSTEPDAATRSLVDELRRTAPPDSSPTVREIARPAPPQPDRPSIAVLPVANMRGDPGQEVNAGSGAARANKASSAVDVRSGSPERRQLTIMVCNMVGSMSHSADLDPEDMRDRIAAFHKMVADTVARFDGFVAQYLNDGAHVYFGYPAAHEHDAEQAVRASFAILEAVGTLKAASDVTLQASVGIATGLVVVGEQVGAGRTPQHVAVGETPNLAAQLQAVAGPGEVVIAADTRRLVGRMFACRALGADEMQGLPQPAEAWQVRGETVGVSRFEARRGGALTSFVNRQEEIELLLRRWDQANLSEGRVVLLSGEPGIGKSRIAESLLVRLEGEPHACLRYFCSPHHTHSPLHPFIAQLERAASFEPGSSARAKLDKLEALLKPTARNVPRDVALIAELLAVPLDGRYPALAFSSQQKREMTLTALLDQLDGVAAQSPVLIVFEDVHWIDPTSQDLLDRTVARVTELPVLLVITSRPELQPTWVGQPHVTMLPLSRLGRRDSAGIIVGVAKGKALPEPLLEQVLSRADGVPLFIEELTSALLEGGLVRETTEGYVLDGPLPSIAIPTTLKASLVARLDRLGSVKDVAQIGAAIGREFSYELLGAVASLVPADLDAALERLTASGLVSRRGAPPIATYSFKHALVQDAAYDTLLKSRRRELHRRMAESLEGAFPEIAETQPEVIARHHTEAQQDERAISWWRKAGQRNVRASANVEAIAHFERCLTLLAKLPERPERDTVELDIRIDLGVPLMGTAGYTAPEFQANARRALEICDRLGEDVRLYPVLWSQVALTFSAGDVTHSVPMAERFLMSAERRGDRQLRMIGHRLYGMTLYGRGDLEPSRRHLEQALELYEPDEDVKLAYAYGADQRVAALSYLGRAMHHLGHPDRGLATVEQALAEARSLAHVNTIIYAQDCMVELQLMRRDLAALAAEAAALDELARGHASRNYQIVARTIRHVMELKNSGVDSVDAIGRGIRELRALNWNYWAVRLCLMAAEDCADAGQPSSGRDWLEQARSLSEALGQDLCLPELYRLRASLLRAEGAPIGEVEAALHRAVETARRQAARWAELRSATRLAQLLRDTGRAAEAAGLLLPLCTTFAEGQDLPDLIEARDLLDSLRSAV